MAGPLPLATLSNDNILLSGRPSIYKLTNRAFGSPRSTPGQQRLLPSQPLARHQGETEPKLVSRTRSMRTKKDSALKSALSISSRSDGLNSVHAKRLPRRVFLQTLASSCLLVAASSQAEAASIKKVFVAGASGGSGKLVVQQLAAKGISVRAGVRNVEKAKTAEWSQKGSIEIVPADLTGSPESLSTAIGDAEAVICAVGASSAFNPSAFDEVDRKGVIKLIDAAKQAGVRKFVLQTSILTNGKAINEGLNPIFLVLNAVTGALDKKLESEKHLRSSGLDYTIVRPGGLKSDPASAVGNLILQNEDTLRAKKEDPGTAISRETVAQVLIAALDQSKAKNRVVEIVASPDAPSRDPSQWF